MVTLHNKDTINKRKVFYILPARIKKIKKDLNKPRLKIGLSTIMATTRKRGRPISLTDLAERKRQADKDRNKGKIFIGDYIERWNRLKSELN